MSSFVLVRIMSGEDPVVIDDYGPYDDGQEAARIAKRLTEMVGAKHQPRRVTDLPDWRPREAQRQAEGYYFKESYAWGCVSPFAPIPAGFEVALDPDHCALVYDPNDDEPRISFFESDGKARIDQRTVLKVGRYLKRYFPGMGEEQLKRHIALLDPPEEVLFATTRDEIRTVYLEGPESCMSMAHRSEWDGLPCHPVEVYAGGDLAVAYIRRQGRITARTLCWPERKKYGRVYGDRHRLIQVLKGLDYSEVTNFHGARLLRIPVKRQIHAHRNMLQDRPDLKRDGFLVPYLDNVDLLIDQGGYLLSAPEMRTDRSTIPHTHGGIPSVSIPAKWCDRLGFWVDGPVYYVRGLEQTWSQRAVYDNGAGIFRCDPTGEYWPAEDRYMVRMHHGGVWSRAYFENHGFVCPLSGWNCSEDDKTLQDGKAISATYLRDISQRERRAAERREIERASAENRDQYAFSYATQEIWGQTITVSSIPHIAPPVWRRVGPDELRAAGRQRVLGDIEDTISLFGLEPTPLGEAAECVTNAVRDGSDAVEAVLDGYCRSLERFMERQQADIIRGMAIPRVYMDGPIEEGSTPPDPNRRPWHDLIDNNQVRSTAQSLRQQRRRG